MNTYKQPIDDETARRRIAAAKLLRREFRRFNIARAQWRFIREDVAAHLGDDDTRELLRSFSTVRGQMLAPSMRDPLSFAVTMGSSESNG
jgi:hypothetical protein